MTTKGARPALGRGLTPAPAPAQSKASSLSRGPIGERRGGPDATGKDARKYPRADLKVKAHLSLAGDRSKSFEASLPTANISVGGLFLESTFFLKIGTLLDVVNFYDRRFNIGFTDQQKQDLVNFLNAL